MIEMAREASVADVVLAAREACVAGETLAAGVVFVTRGTEIATEQEKQ
jgi:hypothetical protein